MVLIMQGPHVKRIAAYWGITCLGYYKRLGAFTKLATTYAFMAIALIDVKRTNGWDKSDIVAYMFTQRQTGEPHEFGILHPSGNHCLIMEYTAFGKILHLLQGLALHCVELVKQTPFTQIRTAPRLTIRGQ